MLDQYTIYIKMVYYKETKKGDIHRVMGLIHETKKETYTEQWV